ncbi:hypothetical protein GUJ93_ZPchr0007g5484 [Zizania palustris]|uniref:Uncharacterized protein n=1 Tax=Zizania palustris TaxID=103762 RepID=A0A8J5T8V8_ZIZPA|nr:hypothetical protein GUJ93_ZPchr0007g5484 [Zizania palustris]
MIQQLAQQNSGFDMSMFQPLPPPPPPLSPTSPECFRTPGQDGASGANVDEAGGSGGAHDPNVGDHLFLCLVFAPVRAVLSMWLHPLWSWASWSNPLHIDLCDAFWEPVTVIMS